MLALFQAFIFAYLLGAARDEAGYACECARRILKREAVSRLRLAFRTRFEIKVSEVFSGAFFACLRRINEMGQYLRRKFEDITVNSREKEKISVEKSMILRLIFLKIEKSP